MEEDLLWELKCEMVEDGFLCPVIGWDEWELDWEDE